MRFKVLHVYPPVLTICGLFDSHFYHGNRLSFAYIHGVEGMFYALLTNGGLVFDISGSAF
jgi:hypothetical protein